MYNNTQQMCCEVHHPFCCCRCCRCLFCRFLLLDFFFLCFSLTRVFMPLFSDFAFAVAFFAQQFISSELKLGQTKIENVPGESEPGDEQQWKQQQQQHISNQSIRSHLVVKLAAVVVVIQPKWYFPLCVYYLRLRTHLLFVYEVVQLKMDLLDPSISFHFISFHCLSFLSFFLCQHYFFNKYFPHFSPVERSEVA